MRISNDMNIQELAEILGGSEEEAANRVPELIENGFGGMDTLDLTVAELFAGII